VTSHFLFSNGTLYADGDGPLSQAQVDAIWRSLPTTGAGWIAAGALYVQQFDGAPQINLGPVADGVTHINKDYRP
jgi:hypothetical protein